MSSNREKGCMRFSVRHSSSGNRGPPLFFLLVSRKIVRLHAAFKWSRILTCPVSDRAANRRPHQSRCSRKAPTARTSPHPLQSLAVIPAPPPNSSAQTRTNAHRQCFERKTELRLGSKQLDLRQEQRGKRAKETWVDQRYEKRQGILFCFFGFFGVGECCNLPRPRPSTSVKWAKFESRQTGER